MFNDIYVQRALEISISALLMLVALFLFISIVSSVGQWLLAKWRVEVDVQDMPFTPQSKPLQLDAQTLQLIRRAVRSHQKQVDSEQNT